MARPKVFDYDAASDETIVTEGVQGFEPQWIGFDVNRRVLHVVVNEGTLNAGGDGLDTITKRNQQLTLEDQDVIDFYTANKATFDTMIQICMEKWAADNSKTGALVY